MIAEVDRYQGVVFRQLLLAHQGLVEIGVADIVGRKDSFYFNDGAFQVKYSTKRLPPWQFTYMSDNLEELRELRRRRDVVWSFLVCGVDGVVGLSFEELESITSAGAGGVAWVRVRRGRNAMYRVAGAAGDLPRAKSRGVQSFVAALAATS